MIDALPPNEERCALAAEYVLRLMPPEDEYAFEARLDIDRALKREVADWLAHFTPLAHEIASIAPPKAVKARLTAELFGQPKAPTSIWARLGLWQGISLTATAVAAVMAVMLVTQPEVAPPATGQMFVSEIVAQDDSLRVLAVYDGTTGDLRLTRTAGQAAGGRDFELWAIIGDNAPVSLGVLTDDGSNNISLPEAFRGSVKQAILAISDEPDGGSPTGAPTGAVLAVGQVSEV